MNDDPDVLKPFGDRSSSSSPTGDILDAPTCRALRTVGIGEETVSLPDFL